MGGTTVANLKHGWLIGELVVQSKWSWVVETLINPRRTDKGRAASDRGRQVAELAQSWVLGAHESSFSTPKTNAA